MSTRRQPLSECKSKRRQARKNTTIKRAAKLYAFIWNSVSGLIPYDWLYLKLINDYLPAEKEYRVLYINAGIGNLEQKIAHERAMLRVTSVGYIKRFLSWSQRHRLVNGFRYYRQSLDTPLKIPDNSIEIIICTQKPSKTLLLEFTRVLVNSGTTIVVAPIENASLWPIIKSHWESASGFGFIKCWQKRANVVLPGIVHFLDQVFHLSQGLHDEFYIDKADLHESVETSGFLNAGQTVFLSLNLRHH